MDPKDVARCWKHGLNECFELQTVHHHTHVVVNFRRWYASDHGVIPFSALSATERQCLKECITKPHRYSFVPSKIDFDLNTSKNGRTLNIFC